MDFNEKALYVALQNCNCKYAFIANFEKKSAILCTLQIFNSY